MRSGRPSKRRWAERAALRDIPCRSVWRRRYLGGACFLGLMAARQRKLPAGQARRIPAADHRLDFGAPNSYVPQRAVVEALQFVDRALAPAPGPITVGRVADH